jgi:hypothetical protein
MSPARDEAVTPETEIDPDAILEVVEVDELTNRSEVSEESEVSSRVADDSWLYECSITAD